MSTANVARRRERTPPGAAAMTLARIEGLRMLRHPAPWIGLLLSVWFARSVDDSWASARYQGLVASLTPLLLGLSVTSASIFGREHVPLSDDAPMTARMRALARLLGGLTLVILTAVVVGATALLIELGGGLSLGDEPGRTLNARYSLPELLQPILLAALAVAAGAAAVHLLRTTLVASIVLFVYWFLSGATYWVFNSDVLSWVSPVQVQPVSVDLGTATMDPQAFPATWLLSAPGEGLDHWSRLVLSPAMAAWHDVYLVALTMLALAAAVPGRGRRPLALTGLLLALTTVLLQRTVSP